MLFVILVLLGFIAMTVAKIPQFTLPEWPAWSLWTVAAFIWALPQLG